MATTTIARWGNANAIRIPKLICNKLDLKPNDTVSVKTSRNKVIIEKTENDYTLQSLMRTWDGNRYEAEEIDWGRPAGSEVW